MTHVERLDPRAAAKISGAAWTRLRPLFLQVHHDLVACGAEVKSELTTIYVKYTRSSDERNAPFAVVWIKKSTELIVGVSAPADAVGSPWSSQLPGLQYAGLTAFLKVSDPSALPSDFRVIVQAAFDNV
ncbi:MAG: hypothetical protein WAZ94_07345 [Phycisphaerales bacterium]